MEEIVLLAPIMQLENAQSHNPSTERFSGEAALLGCHRGRIVSAWRSSYWRNLKTPN